MNVHGMEKSHKCSHCSYASTCDSALKLHMKTHTGEKLYKCSQCSYASNQAGNMKAHLRIHTGEKPYKCDICSYASNHAGNMKAHMRTHTSERPHKCSQCPYSATQTGALKVHMRSHTGVKAYKCNQCSYTSTRPGCLKLHMQIHTETVKPYKCIQCSYSAIQLSTLKIHMRMHNGEFLKCNQCTYVCTQADSLFKHMELHAGDYQALDALSTQTKPPNIEQPQIEPLKTSSSKKPTLVCAKCGQCDVWTIDDLETHIVLKHFRGIDALYKCLYPNCWALFPTESARLRHARDVHLKVMSEIPMGILPQNQDKNFVSLRLAIQQCLNESINASVSNSPVTNKESAISKCSDNVNASLFVTSSTDSSVQFENERDDSKATLVIKEENSVDPYASEGNVENLKVSIIKEEMT